MLPLNAANRVTILRMVFIPVFLVAMLGEWPAFFPAPERWAAVQPWLAAVIFVIVASTDAVDGYLARSRNEVTTFGKLIDPLADKLLVTAALFALVDLDQLPGWIAIVMVSRELIVTGLRMVAVAEGKVIAASSYGKVKTVAQITAIALFMVKDSALPAALGAGAHPVWVGIAWTAMGIALLLTIVSMLEYFYHARDVLTGPWSDSRQGGA